MIRRILFSSVLAFSMSGVALAEKEFMEHSRMMDHGDGHLMDMDGGMVMGQNTDTLPGGCTEISETREITVRAGHKYAEKFPGTMFAFDQQEFEFEPCTKLTVHFINEDEIRHQWMMHGLPKYLYPKGMFHLEVTGPGKISGTLIFPPNDKTYLVHCDLSQHMEKGMKAQLKIGKGSGDLPSIPGVTANVIQDDYSDSIPDVTPFPVASATAGSDASGSGNAPAAAASGVSSSGVMIIGLALGLLIAPFLARKFKGMSIGEVISTIFEMLAQSIAFVIKLITGVIKKFTSGDKPELPKD
jgi:hypothetical protein